LKSQPALLLHTVAKLRVRVEWGLIKPMKCKYLMLWLRAGEIFSQPANVLELSWAEKISSRENDVAIEFNIYYEILIQNLALKIIQ